MAIRTKKTSSTVDPKHATIISEGCSIKGTLSGSGSIRIDGDVQGDVNLKQSVVLGSKGKVTGNISTSEMIVFGKLEGNISAGIVEVKSGGSITGDITTTQMTMELGGKHNGSVSMKEGTATTPVK